MATLRSPVRPTSTPIVLLVGAWLAAVLAAGAAGVFDPSSSGPPMALGVAAGVPPVVFALLVWSSPAVRARVGRFDLVLLTQLQAWRVMGFAFVALYALGTLPGLFALPAGLGDVAVGLAAPFVARALVVRNRAAVPLFFGWTLFGMIDLVAAVTLGVLHSIGPWGLLAGGVTTDPVSQLPLSLIPTFGVPFAMVLHIAALVRLRAPTQPRAPSRRCHQRSR